MTPVIAVGVDGSPESRAAARWAADEAVRRGLGLRLVHAWLWQPVALPMAQDREEEARRADAVLHAAADEVAARHPELGIVTEVVSDAPVPALLREAEQAELLALGTRGHGPVLGFLLGSYGQQVIGEAACPVVSVRAADAEQPDAGRDAGEGSRPGEVVVGQYGYPEDSHDVLGFAFEAAAARGAAVRAVRAWDLPSIYAYSPGSMWISDQDGGLVQYEQAALRRALEPWREKYPEVPVVEHVELGSAGQVLLSAAEGSASLLVVGRRTRKGPVGSRIGSAAHAVLHHARCPVAVVPQS
ncbi:universal stress protein [Streptomyces sp. NPDC090445]|uniref:universal stress protein n=1 Tax=Streptomyces sp. NPDC090445 TaxID=3365963 RepID=UPI0038296740